MDEHDLPEHDSGYEDAPRWYWRVAEHYPGWRGDLLLWATWFGAGAVTALGFAVLALWLAVS